MNHVMIDIETLDTDVTAAILSIGAVAFGRGGVAYDSAFEVMVEAQSCFDIGLTASQKVAQWWGWQSPAVRHVYDNRFDKSRAPIGGALLALRKYIEQRSLAVGEDVLVWGNGANFDNPILSHAFIASGQEPAWPFYNDRCFRTLRYLAPFVEAPIKLDNTTGHNALDDAVEQARHASLILDELGTTFGTRSLA